MSDTIVAINSRWDGAPRLSTLRNRMVQRAIYDREKCRYCGALMVRPAAAANQEHMATLDHIIPVYLGGTNEEKNLMVICSGCNRNKGHHTLQSLLDMAATLRCIMSERGLS